METAHSQSTRFKKTNLRVFFLISSVFHLYFMARTKQSNQAEREVRKKQIKGNPLIYLFLKKKVWSEIVFTWIRPSLAAVYPAKPPRTRWTKPVKTADASEHLQLHQTSPILPPTPQFSWLSIVFNKRPWHFELEAVMDRFWGQKPLPVSWFHPSPVQLQAWIDSWKSCEDQSLIRCGVVQPWWERRCWWRPVQVAGVLTQVLFKRSLVSNCVSSLGFNGTHDFTHAQKKMTWCVYTLHHPQEKQVQTERVHCKATRIISAAWI